MYSEINNKIFQLKEELRIKEKLDSLKRMVESELSKKKTQEQELKKQLIKEEKDVTKLEGTSFSSIFLSLIGKKEEKLDKEREEFIEAKLRCDECILSIRELEKELEYAKNQLRKYAGIKEKYQAVIKEKEHLIINEDSEKGKELRINLDIVNQLKLDIKEIKEAIDAGEKANSALLEMANHLDTAKSWGVWDMLGGGLISNIAKHSAIDNANNIAHNSQHLLKSFERELEDVNEFTEIRVNISSFTTFADFFFDGFFVDWFVQSKINDSLNNVNNTSNKINSIIMDLRRSLNSLNTKLNTTESEIKKILGL